MLMWRKDNIRPITESCDHSSTYSLFPMIYHLTWLLSPHSDSSIKYVCCEHTCINLYVLCSVLWYPLRFPHKNGVRFVFTSSYFGIALMFLFVICVCLRIVVVSNTYHVAFCLSSSCVLCTKCCQFLWIGHSWYASSVSSNATGQD